MPDDNPNDQPVPRGEEKFFLIIVIALAVITGVGSWVAVLAFNHREQNVGLAPDRARHLENFSFTDRTGRTVTRAEVAGKFLAVSFLFTSCSLTCPEVSKRMAEIQRLTKNDADVRLLSITVDPRSDTPPVLAKWGERFGADTNRWFLLTGDKAELHTLIGTSFLETETNNPFNTIITKFRMLKSNLHNIYSVDQAKISLSPYDDKRYIRARGVLTYAHGNVKIATDMM
ncbi:MAG: hypothetical protein RL616_1685 [Verrucomicrobiota bacterium]